MDDLIFRVQTWCESAHLERVDGILDLIRKIFQELHEVIALGQTKLASRSGFKKVVRNERRVTEQGGGHVREHYLKTRCA